MLEFMYFGNFFLSQYAGFEYRPKVIADGIDKYIEQIRHFEFR